MKPTSQTYLGIALILLAILPTSTGARKIGAQYTYIQQSSVHEATVVDHVPKTMPRANNPKVEVYSVVEFVNDSGIRRSAKTNVASYPPGNAIGDRVSVRIHHTRTDDVRLVSFSGLWLESAFYLIPGLLLLTLGLFFFFKKPRARRK